MAAARGKREREEPEAEDWGSGAAFTPEDDDDAVRFAAQRPRLGATRSGASGSPFSDPGLRAALARAIVQSAEQEPTRIARGNFGCIYAPPPRCLDGSRLTVSPSAIGKVSALDEDYRTEAEVLARLERIDPEHRFHVAYYGSCRTADRPDCALEDELDEEGAESEDSEASEVSGTEEGEMSGAEEGGMGGASSRPRGLLVMERAEPLNPAAFPTERLPDALAGLWDGLDKMGAAGIRYEDLHTGNLLVGDDGLWRMVDFGGCTLDADPAETERIHAREMRMLLEASFAHTRIGRRWIIWLTKVEAGEGQAS
jgi:hypothetical protein